MITSPDMAAAAALIFERDRGCPLHGSDQLETELASFDLYTRQEIEDALVATVRGALDGSAPDTDDELLALAVFALGKRATPTLKPLLVDVLRQTIDTLPDVAFQAMIALENLGEHVFGDGASIIEVQRNTEVARRFLERAAG